MNASFARLSSLVLAFAVLTTVLPGCVVGDGGYGYGGVDVGADYYQPVGIGYGGWGPGYRVGPYRGGRPYGGGGVGRPWRGSPGRGPIPSIPGGPRGGGGGGGRGGGFHGGGGRGR